MKNPLTSKERRGLLAVAAAALLCMGMGFVARSCGAVSQEGAAAAVEESRDSVSGDDSEKLESQNVKRARREKRGKASKKKAEKGYPVRDPLGQPCD